MATPQPPPASSKKTANRTTTTTTGARSSLSRNHASSDQNNNTATNSIRLGPQAASLNQQQNLQEQNGHYYTKPQQTQRQRPPQRLSNCNGKDGIQYKKDADAGERVFKKRRLSKPYRSQENIDDSESEKDESQERVRLGGLGAAMGVQGRAPRALTRFEATEAQDEDGTDTDDFQARPMVRSRRHEYGQDHSSNINNNNNNAKSTTTTIKRDLSKIPPYPEHLLSTLPDRSLRSSALTRGATINPSPQTHSVTSAPSHKRPPSKVPSSVSDASRVPDLRTTLWKSKVEEQGGENGPLRPSHSLPAGGPPHEADVYKAMDDHGMDLWKEWCKSMRYDDKDQVTPIKLKDYIDFEVMPKDREMMRKSWRLPGHPGFIAVSGLEAYIRPVVRLWCEQSLQAELEAIRDAKLRTARLQQQQPQQKLDQQQQQLLQPPPPNLQPRQAKPKPRLRPSQQQPPLKDTFVSSRRQPVKTAITTTTTINRAGGRKEGKENVGHEGTEEHDSRRTDEQKKDDETKDDDKDSTNNNNNDRDSIPGDRATSNITERDDRDLTDRDDVRGPTDRDYDQDKTAAGGVSATSSKLVASSTSTLPSTSSLPTAALTPDKSPPTPPSSNPRLTRVRSEQRTSNFSSC